MNLTVKEINQNIQSLTDFTNILVNSEKQLEHTQEMFRSNL